MICISLVGERTRRSLAFVAVATATALVACGGSSEPLGPTATVPRATTTTNPYAVPAVIDEAYVNRVLAGLDQAAGDMLRLVVNSRTIPPEALDRLRALYVGRHRQIQLDLLSADAAVGFANYKRPPGNQATAVTRLIDAGPSCIFAEVSRDYSDVAIQVSTEYIIQWVVLLPSDSNGGRSTLNSTNWVYVYDGVEPDRSAPENPCPKS